MTRAISDFGSLGERTQDSQPLGKHVLVRDDAGVEHPGLLVSWQKDGAGAWLAEVTWVPGTAGVALQLLPADRVRKV